MTRKIVEIVFATAIAFGVWNSPAQAQSSAKVAEGGYTIAFASFAPLKTNIFIANSDGENARPLLAMPDVDYNPSFSRDGAWIVFTSLRDGSADIYRVHPDGSGLERLTDDPAFDDQGVLSPDAKFLAFVSTRGGKANIWLLDMQSRKLKNLTPDSTGDFRPAWSPDGEWIAFSSDRDSTFPGIFFATSHTTEIYMMRRDGSDTRRVTTMPAATVGSPSWSPDGSRIVFYHASSSDIGKVILPGETKHGDMQIVSVDWKTGERSVLREEPGEKWSPRWLSPSQVAYFSGGPSGGIERTEGPPGARGEFWNANWSADGKIMVFHREVDFSWPPFQPWHSLDASFRLVRTGIFPSYSPSGDRLVSNSARAGILHNSILLMNADGSNRKVLFDDPQRSALAPVWSPRGDEIAFGLGEFFQMIPGRQGVTSRLAIIRSDGSGLRVLAGAGDHAGFPCWSPDGQRLVYRTSAETGKGLRIIDLATERVIELTNGPQTDNFPAWSPVGDQIAFTSDLDGDYEIYTIRPDGTNLKRLTQSPGNDAHLAWSHDGKWIAFASARTGFTDEMVLHPYNGQATGEIFVMRADGSDLRRLTENQFEDATPGWRP
jgi:Tol biopolymer transport system component